MQGSSVDEDMEEAIDIGDEDLFDLEVPVLSLVACRKLKQINVKRPEGQGTPGRPA